MSMIGTLVLIGGNEEKLINNIIYQKIHQKLRDHPVISIITTATNYPADLYKEYHYLFESFNPDIIYHIDIQNRRDCYNIDILEKLSKSDFIFLTGGNQFKFKIFLETHAHKILIDRYNKGALIAGTSAGANALGQYMITDGNHDGLLKGSIQYMEGLNIMNNIIFDTHFEERNRIERLSQFMCLDKCKYGIGISENTAIFIQQKLFTIYGQNSIKILNSKTINSNYNKIHYGERIIIDNLNLSTRKHDQVFNLF